MGPPVPPSGGSASGWNELNGKGVHLVANRAPSDRPRFRTERGGVTVEHAMSRVLFMAYYFPPIGGAGVQRSVKFVRYLPEFGCRPVVLTGPGRVSGRWSPRDESLFGDLDDTAEIHRVPGPEPVTSAGWRWRVVRMLGYRSAFERWWIEGATSVGRELAAETDIVFGELVPYTTAQPAARLARELGKPWIADLQDPWALDEMYVYPTAWHRWRDRRQMGSLLSTASAIVMNTPEAVVRLLEAFPKLEGKIVASIPNGFDRTDFEGAPPTREDRAFRIVHSGYFHTERADEAAGIRRLLGGLPVKGVDFLARSHVYLLQALNRLVDAEPQLASTIELHLVGVSSAADRAVSAGSPFVREHGYKSHAETLDLVRSADLLFLPMQGLPPGVRAGLVPGKTYEYLGSGRPILAAVPEGDARDLLTEAGNALICGPTDVDRMTALIAGAIDRWRRRINWPAPNSDVVARYERRRQAEQLADVIHRVARGEGPTDPRDHDLAKRSVARTDPTASGRA
jgi:glycosyltransferase involved in cell wall biosynthesis